jgi:hypothetical protein
LFQLLSLIYYIYPFLGEPETEQGSINPTPVVADFVSKSDAGKTFDKIS